MSSILTEDLGAGESSFGGSIAGFGETAVLNSTSAKLYLKSDGTSGDSAKINVETGDYILDEEGNKVGDDSINQLVYFALMTKKDSTLIPNFGLNLSDTVISSNTEKIVKISVKDALKRLIDKNLVELIDVKVVIDYDKVNVSIKWKDIVRNKINTTSI